MGKTKICLDALPTSCSQLIKLCHKAAPLIRDRAYWIPGNDKEIKIWDDSIMMHPPLSSHCSLHALRLWLDNAGCITLWDISQWEGRNWLRWRLPFVPPELSQARDLLLSFLNGMAPLRMGKKDARGWGAAPGLYTVAQDTNAFMIALTSLLILQSGTGSGIAKPCLRSTLSVGCYATEGF